MVSKSKIYLCSGVCSAVLFLVTLAIGILTVAFLDGILLSQAAKQVGMTPSTYENWGQIPGGYKANVTRRYTFYNFTNPFEVFYFNETPVFVELQSQLYAENSNLLNPSYQPQEDSDATSVDFQFQFFATPIAVSPNDTVTTINLGPLGFWYSAPRLPDYQIASYGISALVANLELDIVTTLQSAAIQFQCAKSFEESVSSIFIPSDINDPDLQSLIWNDDIHGLGNLSTLVQWVHAIANGPDSGSATILGDYFYLTYSQLIGLFGPESFLYTCVNGVNATVADGYNCSTIPCDPNYFVTVQWATQVITADPAAQILTPRPSVTFFNHTVQGYPEIAYYQNASFLNNSEINQTEYENVTWTVELATQLLYFSPNPDVLATNPNTLLHFGNEAFLYQYGEAFDALNNITDLTILQPVMDRFGLPSLQHAHVLWSYMKYIKFGFIERTQMNGTIPDLIIGEFASTALYDNHIAVMDNIPFDLTARIIMNNITNAQLNCSTLLQSSSIILQESQANTICGSPYFIPFDIDAIEILYAACYHPNGPEFTEVIDSLQGNITRGQLLSFCGTFGETSFMTYAQFADLYLKNHYGCAAAYPNATRCSQRELAVMQWSNSTISQNVPEMLNDTFTSSMTIADWYPDLVPTPYEYLPALNKLARNFGNDTSAIQPIPYNIANQVLTFNTLFNEITVQGAFISFNNQDWDWFEETLFGLAPYPLILYLRYVMMELSMGGFAQTRSVGDLLWGYNDTFLTKIKNRSPLDSGDPSLANLVTLAGPNCTDPDSFQFAASMYTGINESSLTRNFITINQEPFITYNHIYFNGNETVSEFISPWAANITLQGTDGVINSPGLQTSDNVNIYISDLNFQSALTYSGNTEDYFDLQAYRYNLPANALENVTNNPANEQWYSDRWDGLINISMIHRAPLFVSKGHFLDVDPFLQNAVVLYPNASTNVSITPTEADNLYVDIEPYSGGAVGTLASLQINYEYSQDPLFASPNYAMLPVLLTQRGMSFTQDMVKRI